MVSFKAFPKESHPWASRGYTSSSGRLNSAFSAPKLIYVPRTISLLLVINRDVPWETEYIHMINKDL